MRNESQLRKLILAAKRYAVAVRWFEGEPFPFQPERGPEGEIDAEAFQRWQADFARQFAILNRADAELRAIAGQAMGLNEERILLFEMLTTTLGVTAELPFQPTNA